MTRETKIGLLVGLAFIIVVGILLSDHFTNTVQPQQAPIAVIGETVRNGAQTPGAGGGAAPATVIAQNVQPQHPVPTRQDLNVQQPPPGVVEVGPNPDAGSARVVIVAPSRRGAADADAGGVNPPPGNNTGGSDASNQNLIDLARRHDLELVPVDDRGPVNGGNTLTAVGTRNSPAGQLYQAQAGDTVSRMAARFYGANTAANRELIIKANPSLLANPNRVIVGQKYLIPSQQPAQPPASPAAATPAAPPSPPNSAPLATRDEYYITREGDTLWKIAVEQLGSARALSAIVDLNRDVIRDVNVLKPNTKLRLPPRSVAVAQ